MLRIGQGFDIHKLEQGRAFILGGIKLDWHSGPVGHSDGDVLLHAIIDALLGASGMGDIGEWFPPDDKKWQEADSSIMLKKVIFKLKRDGWTINNVDTTVLLEDPKLSLYKENIRNNIACIMDIKTEQIGIKAKTMEGMDAIGHREAVGAMVSVLLQK